MKLLGVIFTLKIEPKAKKKLIFNRKPVRI